MLTVPEFSLIPAQAYLGSLKTAGVSSSLRTLKLSRGRWLLSYFLVCSLVDGVWHEWSCSV